MSPSFQEDEGPTPAKVCASYDVGGGVGLADAFAIYSIVAFPPSWRNNGLERNILQELEEAASVVADKLPILTFLSNNLLPDLTSLPFPCRQHRNDAAVEPYDDLPWFLINATRYSKHCVLGQNNTLESLLMVLQRPWCVLELCCCETPTVAAVGAFTLAAAKLDRVTYSPAVMLLSYEMMQRTNEQTQTVRSVDFQNMRRQQLASRNPWLDAIAVYRELSRSCIRSHKAFWIGLICTCAVYLGIAFSDVTLMLASLFPGASVWMNVKEPGNTRLEDMPGPFDPRTSNQFSAQLWRDSNKPTRIRRSSIDVIQRSSPNSHFGKLRNNLSNTDPTNFPLGTKNPRLLFTLYAEIIRATGDSIP
ncbi:hypothetical protein N7462_000040 [Penicillium macrosclerotiorum]|uniref:uncharacterized protein n=1 Tax=Penicillium macrosclerotiorum TaxID=303699 RepID=UPI00254827D1|nr:uncharacterized protein N7462_000040 [Penicillium macrosclerotiorum]KAJ5698035.1 hypothetical protein N7462_000040 [Penicillium macrosclerotiorum]